MALCRKLVEGAGFGIAFPCDLELPEGHDGPCRSISKPASVAAREKWLSERKAMNRKPEPVDPIYVEPRRSIEFMVDPAHISPVPGTRADVEEPPPWEPPPIVNPEEPPAVSAMAGVATASVTVHHPDGGTTTVARETTAVMSHLVDQLTLNLKLARMDLEGLRQRLAQGTISPADAQRILDDVISRLP